MSYKYQIRTTNYSIGDNYTYKDDGNNPSTIITKMVQIAGRLCEHYASDIVYDAVAFRDAVEENKPYDRYLFFRECGVSAFHQGNLSAIGGTSFIQAWHLTFDPDTKVQLFTRIHVIQDVIHF